MVVSTVRVLTLEVQMNMNDVFVCRILQCCGKQKRTQKEIEILYKKKYPPGQDKKTRDNLGDISAALAFLVEEKKIKKEVVGNKNRLFTEGTILYFLPTNPIERFANFVMERKNEKSL